MISLNVLLGIVIFCCGVIVGVWLESSDRGDGP